MGDIFSKKKRSDVMSKIRGKNTTPERIVFKYLRKEGVYFQKHYDRIAGSPDIALPRKKRAVFIDGDFWHGRTFEKRKANLPPYWVNKLKRNLERDKVYRRQLSSMGWDVFQVWESDIVKKDNVMVLKKIKIFLTEGVK